MSKQKISISEARVALNKLAETKNKPTDKDGHLDLKAFQETPEVKKAISDLKELGVDKKWLWSNGFMAAGILLNFN